VGAPGPVTGKPAPGPYTDRTAQEVIDILTAALARDDEYRRTGRHPHYCPTCGARNLNGLS
jgi:hypothetical protein